MMGVQLLKHSLLPLIAVLSIAAVNTAAAKPKHHGPTRGVITCTRQGCSDWGRTARAAAPPVIDANGNVVGRRPPGCPHAFCGCEASRYVFGRIRPKLNLAANWMVKFPRTAPAPGMVAARRHHVMVLMSHVSGSQWLVHDGNSGGGLTRNHVVSIRDYVIVDPHGVRTAAR